jgi:hypothetical protein
MIYEECAYSVLGMMAHVDVVLLYPIMKCTYCTVTEFSLYPQYAFVTYVVTWQVNAAVELVCVIYLLVFREVLVSKSAVVS